MDIFRNIPFGETKFHNGNLNIKLTLNYFMKASPDPIRKLPGFISQCINYFECINSIDSMTYIAISKV